jgi:chromosome segregation protein
MRLDRLDLPAYGHFTNRTLAFAADARLHVVYGANEAGKSTILAAISDLLFGYKAKDHPYTFLHPKPLLGGRIRRDDGTVLEFVRQRSNRGAGLVSPDQRAALDDGALAAFLLGVGKDEFERLHSLNHARLRDGGAELLKPDSDIGRKLFAAGTGLDDLSRVEASLAADIERLGEHVAGGRGQKAQALKAAALDYDAADRELKAASLKAGEVAKARDRLAAAEKAAATARDALAQAVETRARLTRARRVRPLLAELDRLRQACGGGDGGSGGAALPDLPDDLAERWAAATRRQEIAAAEAATAAQAEQDAAADLAALPPLGPFAASAGEIIAVAARLGEYRKAGGDLPRCQAERRLKLEAVVAALRDLGLELTVEEAEDRRPGAVFQTEARNLAARRREARQAVAAAQKAQEKAQVQAQEAERALAALGPAVDPGEAEALAAEAESLRDAPARRDGATAAAAQARAEAERALTALVSLGFWRGDRAELAALASPAGATINAFDTENNELSLREKALAAELGKQEGELSDVTARLSAIRQAGEPPAQAAVAAARRRRDELIRALATGTASDEAALAAAAQADHLADRRLAEAKRVQEFETALERQAVATARLKRLNDERAALAAARDDLAARRRAAWGCVTVERVADMRDWAAARTKALELWASADKAERERAAAAAQYARWAALWRAAALALNLPFTADESASDADADATAARTRNLLHSLRRQGEQRRLLLQRAAATMEAAAAAGRETEKLQADLAAFDAEWTEVADRLGQRPDLPDAALETALGLWAAIDAASRERRDLDHRIQGMQRDRAAFEARVDDLRARVAAGGAILPAEHEAAVAALQQGLDADKRSATLAEEKRRAAATRRREKEAADRRRVDAAQAAAALRAAYGLGPEDDVQALCLAAAARRRLLAAGDGRGEEALRRETAETDADAVEADLAAAESAAGTGQAALNAAFTELGEAKSGWETLQRETGAEAAAARRNEAARRAGQAADEVLQLKAAQFLLRRAVARYREANQDPLLGRASALFAAVASANAGIGGGGDPIVGLDSRVGADDRPRLHAVRRDGGAVAVEGLSEGTADQLFLALRLAALEQKAAAGRSLPFIADDIFMTFDDGRTEAGLRLLAELGRTTQVIVFTHHARVVEAAAQATDGAADIIDISRAV